MPISLDEVNRALMVAGRREGYCWCVVPLRQMVDVRGQVHASCGLPITDASYELTARQRGDAVNEFYGPGPDFTPKQPRIPGQKRRPPAGQG